MVIEFKQPPKAVKMASEIVTLLRERNRVVALIGWELQSGIGGVGDTVPDALRDLADRMEAVKYRLPKIEF